MGRKKVLERRQQRLLARREQLVKRSDESNNIEEVRSINEQLQQIAEDLQDVADELSAMAEGEGDEGEDTGEGNGSGEGSGEGDTSRSVIPGNAQLRGGNPVATYVQNPTQQREGMGSYLDTMEYRNAFANYVRSGDTSGFANIEMRADAQVTTVDIGKIIPNTIMQEFIKELKVYGNIYNKVRKLNIQGGVEFPIEELVPTVTWITETTVSETKKAPEYKTSISFGYHICEARIAQSLLSQVVSLPVLEKEIAKLLVEAFTKEFDRMIISGTGSGQPLGILKDKRVKAENKIKFTSAELSNWTKWRTKLFAQIPIAYRGQGILVMTANTWETYCMTLKDSNNNPIGTETFGITDGATTCRFAGKEVVLVEPDILADFDTAADGAAWGLYFKPTDYAINSNLQIGFKRYFNDDTNKWVNKGLCILDGKMLDVNSCYILTK